VKINNIKKEKLRRNDTSNNTINRTFKKYATLIKNIFQREYFWKRIECL